MGCSVQGGTDFCTARVWKTAEMSGRGEVERRDGNAAEVLERVCGDSEVEDGLVKDWWGKRFSELEGWI
jgi:hypothetical protein